MRSTRQGKRQKLRAWGCETSKSVEVELIEARVKIIRKRPIKFARPATKAEVPLINTYISFLYRV